MEPWSEARPGACRRAIVAAIVAVVTFGLGASACCSATATRGCLTPEQIRSHARPGDTALAGYLRDDRSWVREEAARALGLARDHAARGELEQLLLRTSERPWVRAAAAEALGAIGDPASLGALTGVAAAPDAPPEVKLAVIGALCLLGSPEALQAVAPLTTDADLLVAALAEACGAHRTETSLISVPRRGPRGAAHLHGCRGRGR